MKTKHNEFTKLWLQNFPESPPVSYWFKWAYPDIWFRIHSLPKSKRYPKNEKDWKILLKRQNEIITDMFGLNSNVYLVSSDADWEFNSLSVLYNANGEMYQFNHIEQIDLYKLDANYYKNEYKLNNFTYKPIFAKIIWNPYLHDNLLKEIAIDNTRAVFVSFTISGVTSSNESTPSIAFGKASCTAFHPSFDIKRNKSVGMCLP